MKGFFGGRIYSHQLPAPTQSFSFLIADAAAVLLLQLLPLVQSSLAFALMPKRPSPAPARTAPFPPHRVRAHRVRLLPSSELPVCLPRITHNISYLYMFVQSLILDSCVCSPNPGHLLLPVKRSPRRRRRSRVAVPPCNQNWLKTRWLDEKLCTRSMVKSDCILITEPIPTVTKARRGWLACLLVKFAKVFTIMTCLTFRLSILSEIP